MNHAVIMSSEITKWNRMDARFFIALRSVEARYEALLREFPGDKGKAIMWQRLALLRPVEKTPCLVLARGQGGPSKLEAVEKEYPHLAWALIEPTLSELLKRRQDEVNALQQRLDDILKIGGTHV